MLEKVIWGYTAEDWGISILNVLGTILIARLVAWFNKKVVWTFTKKTKNRFDDILYDSLESPVVFGIVLVGLWVAINRLTHSGEFMETIGGAYTILIVLNFTWFLARLSSGSVEAYLLSESGARKQRNASKMGPVVRRMLLALVWIIGIITALSNVGVYISALLGTLGIGGIAFALAAQDTVKNIFGAFTIFTDKPFGIGDTVRIDGFEGTIIDVGIRSTKMRDYDKRVITFPNCKGNPKYRQIFSDRR